MSNVIPQLSVDVRMIFDRLVAAEIGDTISYAEINDMLGRKGKDPAQSVISSARRKALNEHRMVFAAVAKVGIKRLSDVEVVDTSEFSIDKVRRASRRAARRIASVNFDALPNDKKIRHNTYLSMFGALASITTGASMKKLEGKIAESKMQLPLAKTLEAFK